MSGLRLAALLTTERERETYNQTLRKSSQTRSLQTLNLLYTHQCNNLRQNVSEVAEKCGRWAGSCQIPAPVVSSPGYLLHLLPYLPPSSSDRHVKPPPIKLLRKISCGVIKHFGKIR